MKDNIDLTENHDFRRQFGDESTRFDAALRLLSKTTGGRYSKFKTFFGLTSWTDCCLKKTERWQKDLDYPTSIFEHDAFTDTCWPPMYRCECCGKLKAPWTDSLCCRCVAGMDENRTMFLAEYESWPNHREEMTLSDRGVLFR